VHVREATVDDAEALCGLWFDLVSHLGAEGPGDSPTAVMAKAVLRYAEQDSGRILVAELDQTVVGCGFVRVGIVSPLDEGRVVHLSHVQVAPAFGRQGVGSALVEASLTWAEQRGIESLVTAVPANDREANRFLARLGMAPVATLRGGSVTALRARLPHAGSVVARQSGRAGRSVGQVVAARRSQRRARARQATL
jgi:GNAT superfamily N-acetyltransferase